MLVISTDLVIATEFTTGPPNRLGRSNMAQVFETPAKRIYQFNGGNVVPKSTEILFDVCCWMLH